MEIREFKAWDWDAVDRMQFELQNYFAEIDETGSSRRYESVDEARKYMDLMMRDAENMNGKILVAEEDGELVGFIQGVIVEHEKGNDETYDLNHYPGKEGWIGLLFVWPEYRGKKVGWKLVEAIRKYFEEQKCTSVRLLVLADNVGAVRFYEKCGFRAHDVEMVAGGLS